MLKKFRTYQLALDFHSSVEGKEKEIPGYLKNQLLRASSSVVLNLAEGAGKKAKKEKVRFYWIAMGSLRECQASLEIAGPCVGEDLFHQADLLGAHLYCLIRAVAPSRWFGGAR